MVVAIDVIPKVQLKTVPKHLATLTDRGMDLLLNNLSKGSLEDADFVLRPIKEKVNSFNVKRSRRLIDLGFSEVERHITAIRKLLK